MGPSKTFKSFVKIYIHLVYIGECYNSLAKTSSNRIDLVSEMVLKLKFCPQCNTALKYQDKEGKIYRLCPKCGYEESVSEPFTQEYKVEAKVTVIGEDEKKMRTMPTTSITCPRCGHGVAYFWTAQTRSGDESDTQFFKCKKCGHTWRLYT